MFHIDILTNSKDLGDGRVGFEPVTLTPCPACPQLPQAS